MLRRLGKVALWCVGALVVVVIVMESGGNPETAAKRKAESDALFEHVLARNIAKDLVRKQLRDPDSAKFGEISVWQRNALEWACGYVNAKNAFGGFAGMTPFIAFTSLRKASVDDESAEFERAWGDYCAGMPRG